MKTLNYIKNVLGVTSIFRPLSMDKHYRIYKNIQCEYLLFTTQDLSDDHRALISRMMTSLNQNSWAVVHLKSLSLKWIESILTRTSSDRIIFFGADFISLLSQSKNISTADALALNQNCKGSLPSKGSFQYVVTHGLDEFSKPSADKERIKKIKLRAFDALKKLCL